VARDESDGDVWIHDATTHALRVGPQLPTHPQKRRDRYFRYNSEFSEKKRRGKEREKKGAREKGEGEMVRWPNRGTRNLSTAIRRISIEYK